MRFMYHVVAELGEIIAVYIRKQRCYSRLSLELEISTKLNRVSAY